MSNTFGKIFKVTTFGESHGKAVGGIVDGFPAGIEIDEDFIQKELDRRRPGQSVITTPRDESDRIEFLSGIYEGKSTGTPIAFLIWNKNQHSSDYQKLKDVFRPSHADYTYTAKYGIRDYRGGGRSSARETIARVAGGAMAKLVLQKLGITIQAYTSQAGNIVLEKNYSELDLSLTESNAIRCPDPGTAERMIELVKQVKAEGDTIGGVISCVIKGTPVGLGEPVFGKLHAELAKAMLSINAAKGFDYGMGFAGTTLKGSEANDPFVSSEGAIHTKSNYSGGIQGGISNGEDIYFRVAFKPVPTILQEQQTVNSKKENVTFHAQGRHDPCVLPRAVPIVEAMAAMVLLDAYLLDRSRKIE